MRELQFSIQTIVLALLIMLSACNPKPKTEAFSTKNTIGIDGGFLYSGFLGGVSSSINYERFINRFMILRTGIGYYLLAGSDSGINCKQIPLTINLITGRRNSYFEVDLGGRILFDIKDYKNNPTFENRIFPIVNIGYRYQKPKGGLFFKSLIGIDGLTLGLGYAF